MTLQITNPKADILARELAKRSGESVEDAVIKALEERLARNQPGPTVAGQEVEARMTRIVKILDEIDKLPVLDSRAPDEMLYDDSGLPA
jgi:antitoxin VapB